MSNKKQPKIVLVDVDKIIAEKLGAYSVYADLQGAKHYTGDNDEELIMTLRSNWLLKSGVGKNTKYRLIPVYAALTWCIKHRGLSKTPGDLVSGLI